MRRPNPLPTAALSLAALLTPGCTSPDLGPAERAAVISEVEAATRAFEAAQVRRDVDAIVALLAPDFSMLQDGARVRRDAVVRQIEATIPALRELETEFLDLRVVPLGRDAAVASFRFEDAIVDAEGERHRSSGATTLVWRRLHGAWRMVFADADHDAPAGD